MDNKEKPLEGKNNGGTPARNTARNNRRRVSTRRRISTAAWNSIAQIAIAIIGVIGTITVAWLSYQANQHPPTEIPVAASIIATSSPAPTKTPIPVTETSPPIASPSSTSTITITVTAIETITLTPAPILIAFIDNDRSAGRPPLTVNFDARDSYLIASDGQQYPCRNGSCNYTWKVVSDGQKLEKSQLNSSGKFQYTFGKRGKYLISVWICRGKDAVNCGGNGIYIEVG